MAFALPRDVSLGAMVQFCSVDGRVNARAYELLSTLTVSHG